MAERRRVVALVTDAIAPYHRGGKELRYQELSVRLARRAEVHVYTMNWWCGSKVRVDGDVTYHAVCPLVPLYRGRRRSIRQAVTFALSTLRLLFARFDVIEADSMPYIHLLPLKLVALLRRRRLVVTWHESWGLDYWRSYLGSAGRVGWLIESIASRLPDAIIAASSQTGARLTDMTASGTPVIVAPNGIDLGRIDEARPSRELLDLVTVGRLLPHKRCELLIDAVALLSARGRPLRTQIIGTGPEYNTLRAHAGLRGVSSLVSIREDVASADSLYSIIKAARAAVFPSEREGFGIAVLEALACRVPVIVTSAPDNLSRVLAERARNGYVCEPTPAGIAAAIESALDEPRSPSIADRAWIREYDWDTICDVVEQALS